MNNINIKFNIQKPHHKTSKSQKSNNKIATNIEQQTCKITNDKIALAFKGALGCYQQKASEPIKEINTPYYYLDSKTDKNKIVCYYVDDKLENKTIELPKYLYHFTGFGKIHEIFTNKKIQKTQNEQLKGVYLLDSENFIDNYPETYVSGKKLDLMTSIFHHANRENNNLEIPFEEQKIAVIRIPTSSLLSNGKLRIRTQQDFFEYTNTINKYSEQLGKKGEYNIRKLSNDDTRKKFEKELIDKKILTQQEARDFIQSMTNRLHHGYFLSYSIQNNLNKTHSIEYIYNKDIDFNIHNECAVKIIHAKDYILDLKTGSYNKTKVKNIFKQDNDWINFNSI